MRCHSVTGAVKLSHSPMLTEFRAGARLPPPPPPPPLTQDAALFLGEKCDDALREEADALREEASKPWLCGIYSVYKARV